MKTGKSLPSALSRHRIASSLRWRAARLAREPFTHFVVLGALLFGVYAAIGGPRASAPDRIHITAADVAHLRSVFEQRSRRPPTEAELDGLIEDRIREEVLYREALALGLDKDDTIVRRRLAQKVEFLVTDVGALAEPDDAALTDYYARHPDRYRYLGRLSFEHIYFSPHRRGARAASDATELLGRLRTGRLSVARSAGQGDTSLLEPDYAERATDEIARQFGSSFADTLARLPVGVWQGPVASAYGLHLVRVSARTDSHQPELGAVREQVKRDYLDEQRRRASDRVLERLRSRYEITVADPPGGQTTLGALR